MTVRDIAWMFIGFLAAMLLGGICVITESRRVYVRAYYRGNAKVIDMPIDMAFVRYEYDITPSNSTVTCHFAPKGTADAGR